MAEISLSLQIKKPIGRHRSVRTVRSIQIFPVGSIQIFEICDKCVQKISWNQKSGENPPLIIAHSPLTNSAHFRIPTFRCGMGLSQTRSTPEVWDPKKSGLYKEQLSNKVWLFFPQKHLNFSVSRKNLNQTDRENLKGPFDSNFDRENLNRTDLSNQGRHRSMSPSRSLICKRKPIAAKEPS